MVRGQAIVGPVVLQLPSPPSPSLLAIVIAPLALARRGEAAELQGQCSMCAEHRRAAGLPRLPTWQHTRAPYLMLRIWPSLMNVGPSCVRFSTASLASSACRSSILPDRNALASFVSQGAAQGGTVGNKGRNVRRPRARGTVPGETNGAPRWVMRGGPGRGGSRGRVGAGHSGGKKAEAQGKGSRLPVWGH